MQPSSSHRTSTQHLPLSPFRPANHAAHAIAHAIAKRKPFSIPPLASTTTTTGISRLQDIESLQHENRRLKLGLRQSKEKALLLQTKNQRLEAEMKRRDRHIDVLLTSTKKPAALVSTPLRQEVHKIRQHQERSTAIKSLQQELVSLRSTVTSLKEKTKSPKAQTLAELTAERDEYLSEVMYLRDVLQEISAAKGKRTEAMGTTTTCLVVPPVTGLSAGATVAEREESTTTAAMAMPEVLAELTGPATTTSTPSEVVPIPSTSSAPEEKESAAAPTTTITTAPPTNEEMERGIPQPSPSLSSSSLPSSSSSSRIPKYHHSSQSLPVRPQHMFRDSLVFFKPPYLEGSRLGSISEDENDREEGEGEAVVPAVLVEKGEEGEEEKREEGREEGDAQRVLERGVVTSKEEGLVVVKENEQTGEEEQEEEGACLSTCSLYLSQLSPLGQQPDQSAEEEREGEEVSFEGSMQQTINMMPMEEVEEGKEEKEEEGKRQEKEGGGQGGDVLEMSCEL